MGRAVQSRDGGSYEGLSLRERLLTAKMGDKPATGLQKSASGEGETHDRTCEKQ
jgi:hypothetical protein